MRGNKLLTNGKVVYKGQLIDADIIIEDGRITYIGKIEEVRDYKEVIDARGQYVIPGMIDIHTHGGNQIDVNHANKEDILELSRFFASRGVTSYLPTLATDTHETMCYLLREIASAKQEQIEGAQILGVHMEGPFLCTAFKGAMPEEFIQDGSIERVKIYEESSNHLIKYMTISPENKGSIDVISYLREKGIVVSIGHTGADYEMSMACIETGAMSATHVFNAMGSIHQHRPAAIGAALESDVYCEIICDGFHLHPAIVRLMIKTKGMDRIIAITDSIMAAGLEDGNYQLGVNDIIVKNGDAQLLDGVRAGSTLTMDRVLKNLIQFTGMPLEKVIDFMTTNPAKLLGIYHDKGEIEVGKEADLVILDAEYMPIYTLIKGNITYRANEQTNQVI